MDIVKLIGQFATPAMLGQIASLLGVSSDKAQKGLGAAIPGVLASILGATAKPGGADAFGTAMARQGGGGLDGLMKQLGQDPGSAASAGSDLLGSLLGGGMKDTLVSKLASYAGLPAGGAGSLLGLAGSIAMGAIGKEASDKGLDAAGALRALEGQKSDIVKALPADFASALQGTGLLPAMPAAAAPRPAAAAPRPAAVSPTPPRPAAPPPARSSGWTRWAIGIVILAVVLWLLSRLFHTAPVPETPVATAPAPAPAAAPATPEPAPAAAPAPAPAMAPAAPATEAAAPAMAPAASDVEATVKGALDKITSALGTVTDATSAQAALPQLTEARDALNGIDAGTLPDTAKSGLKTLVAAALPAIKAAADKLMADSAIAGVVKPVVDEIMGKLTALSA